MSVDYIFEKTNPDQTTIRLHKEEVITAFKNWIDALNESERPTALALYNAQQDKINAGMHPDEASTPELQAYFGRFCTVNNLVFLSKYDI